jgi:hypothetical protein
MSAKKEAFRIFMLMRTEICLLHDSELLKDKIAKNLALIAVDEILNELDLQNHLLRSYWYDVKQEIENYEV